MIPTSISIYGDSIMKATVPDSNLKYHFHFDSFMDKYANLPLAVMNRSRFGATVQKGLSVLTSDLKSGIHSKYALLEFGGNDCNFNWAEIADDPYKEHLPNTDLCQFVSFMETMADKLIDAGVTPVLMSLPPLDADKYFSFICKDKLNPDPILKWLGDTSMIYRFHELYSDSVYKLAVRKNLIFIDVRQAFLSNHNFKKLISADGIHPSEQGYSLIFDTLFCSLPC